MALLYNFSRYYDCLKNGTYHPPETLQAHKNHKCYLLGLSAKLGKLLFWRNCHFVGQKGHFLRSSNFLHGNCVLFSASNGVITRSKNAWEWQTISYKNNFRSIHFSAWINPNRAVLGVFVRGAPDQRPFVVKILRTNSMT